MYAASRPEASRKTRNRHWMVVLDTDHLSLSRSNIRRSGRYIATPGCPFLAQIEPREIATTIVTLEEQTRGWLAYHA